MHWRFWKRKWKCVLFVGLGFLAIYLIPLAVYVFAEHTDAGQFGDVFGFSNAIVSGFAFAAIVITLTQQQTLITQGQKALKIQQKELRDNREELRLQREEMEEHNAYLQTQEFENRFFRLLASIQNVVDNTEVGEARGRQALAALSEWLTNHLLDDATQLETREGVAQAYTGFYEDNGNTLGHYFRMLYHLVRIVNDAKHLRMKQKRVYIRVIRAHLSQSELVLLFYNGLSDYGFARFYPLIERYDLLQNIDPDGLAMRTHLRFYPRLFAQEEARFAKNPPGPPGPPQPPRPRPQG